MGDLGQQGLFDITRILLQQPDLAALSETLTRLVQQSALADRAAIILWNHGNHRAAGTPATTPGSRQATKMKPYWRTARYAACCRAPTRYIATT